jgi:hypothetical protein
MAPKMNGPLAGPTFGIVWEKLPLKKPVLYRGTSTGAKANATRANRRYPNLRFRTFQKRGRVYVERII